jgi:hypothetical protein
MIGPPISDRSMGMGQTDCSLWSSRFSDSRGPTRNRIDYYETTDEPKIHPHKVAELLDKIYS